MEYKALGKRIIVPGSEFQGCWQSARNLCQLIYILSRNEKFSKDFALINQIRNSSGSAMDNIAEGFDRAGNKEFIQFLAVSRGSIAEIKSQLNRALNQEYIDNSEFDKAYDLANQTSKEITNFILYLRKSNLKGFKFSQILQILNPQPLTLT